MVQRRARAVPAILTLCLLLSGCGTSGNMVILPPPPAKTEFLYTVVASGSPPNISFQLLTFDLDVSTGSLAHKSTQAWTRMNANFAVSPGSKFLYASAPLYTVASFSLDAKTGVPSSATSLILTGGICGFGCLPPSAPGALAMDPDGNFLFYGSSTIGGVTEGVGSLAVNAGTGGLSVVPGSPFAVNNVPFMVASHPTGKFLYTADLGPLLGGFTLQSVSAFSVDAVTGALSPVNSPYPAPANSTVHGLVIHPSGNFVYAPAGPSVGILGWSVGQDGSLTSLPGSPFAPGIAAVNGTFDPTGKFFYLSGSLGGGILGYSVNSADGSLAPLAGSPFGVGSTFASPTLDPSGQFLFAGDFQNQAVAEFRVDGNSGALTSVGSTPTSGIPETLVVVQAP